MLSICHAQPFTTGSNIAGYTLTGVTFPLYSNTNPLPDGLQVSIESSGSDNLPGGTLGALTLSRSGETVTGTTIGIDLMVLYACESMELRCIRPDTDCTKSSRLHAWRWVRLAEVREI